jgi:hypothetical protein
MNRIFGLLALLGFTLSLVVHISALIGIDVSSKFPYVWALHFGIFIVFIPFVLISRKDLGVKPSYSQIRDRFPMLIISIGLFIFIYAFINFFLFMGVSHNGTPIIKGGKFILQNHGQFIREITNSEYIALKANEVRGFSGHWLVFYFIPFANFMFAKKSNSQQERSQGFAF